MDMNLLGLNLAGSNRTVEQPPRWPRIKYVTLVQPILISQHSSLLPPRSTGAPVLYCCDPSMPQHHYTMPHRLPEREVGDFYSPPRSSSCQRHHVRFHDDYKPSHDVPLPHPVTPYQPIRSFTDILHPLTASGAIQGLPKPSVFYETSGETIFNGSQIYPQIHPLLIGERSSGPKTSLDLSSLTFMAMRVQSSRAYVRRPLTYDELRESATYPPVQKINIVANRLPDWATGVDTYSTSTSPSPWKSSYISIPLSANNNSYITVYDVLAAIYIVMQAPISYDEWVHIFSIQSATTMAYKRCCARYRDIQVAEEAKGVRRVDCLCGQHMFYGIVVSCFQGGSLGVKLTTVE